MVYFKQDERYADYLNDLLNWALELDNVIKSELDQGESGRAVDASLSLEVEELIEEIKHCQVAVEYQLKPDYLFTLYERANRLYEQVHPALDPNRLKDDKDLQNQVVQNNDQKENNGQKENVDQESDPLTQEKREIQESESSSEGHPVPIGGHRLPPLPYAYEALEPYISREIMRLHHQKHHQSYVDGLNKAEQKMEEARRTGQFELLRHWEREAAFNGSGHYLHTIFWNNMSPQGGGEPKGELAKQIKRDFGSFKRFKRHFTEAAKQAEGVGWAILVWSCRSHRLEILVAEKHQHFAQWDVIPLLVLDVWEHAYYLQYKNDRAEYIKQWWHVVNWNHVEARFNKARKLRWSPY
jgi:Fe-Mn family superoxide dismutase